MGRKKRDYRAEYRRRIDKALIRREITRVLYADFRSMYPTVCTLMGLWHFVIAQGFDWIDWTDEARNLLGQVTLSDLQNPEFWRGHRGWRMQNSCSVPSG